MQKKIYIYTNERTYNMYSTHIHMDFFLNFLLDPNNRSNCRKSSSSTSWSSRLHLQFLQIFRQKCRSSPGHPELQFTHGAPAPVSCAKRGWNKKRWMYNNQISIIILRIHCSRFHLLIFLQEKSKQTFRLRFSNSNNHFGRSAISSIFS